MEQVQTIQLREKAASFFLTLISAIGVLIFIYSAFSYSLPDEIFIYIILLLFIGVTEYFPVPIWKGTSALSFPLLYTMNLIMGISVTIISYAVIVVLINLIHRRPVRLIWFTPAQLIISLLIALKISNLFFLYLAIGDPFSSLSLHITYLLIFTCSYYIINNAIVDLLLWIRPQAYNWKQWRMKTVPEALVVLFSFSYCAIMLFLSTQDRGEVDMFSFLFFFSPLVAISIISAIFVQIKKEKERLHVLFSVTSELNRIVPSGGLARLKEVLQHFIPTQATALWIMEQGECSLLFHDGNVEKDVTLSANIQEKMKEIKETVVFDELQILNAPANQMFSKVIRSLVYSPLLVEDELIGVFIVGRSRSRSFTKEDVQSIATLANQLAVLLKTRSLIAEQEKRSLLEERNRIARQIHDGIAQSLAGAVFKLETASRRLSDKPIETKKLIEQSIKKLRASLKDIRQSIYALRPYPTEQLGLKQAILKRIAACQNEYPLHITFEERGNPNTYSSLVEKVIFDIFQESLQNIVKHAQAKQVHILLSHNKEQITLKVVDDGVGFSLLDAMIKAKNEPHYGILNMNEQAEKVGAILQINSHTGRGTEIFLSVPKIEEEEEVQDDTSYASG